MTSNQENKVHLTNPQLVLEQVTAAIPIGIMISDIEGKVIFRNNLFEKWISTFPVENKLWLLQMIQYLDQDNKENPNIKGISINTFIDYTASYETEIGVNWQGQKFFFRIKICHIVDEKNQFLGLIEETENITEQKELEKSLQHARRFETVGRLASGIAHDFNNILQVINGHSEMLMEMRKEDAKLTRSLDIILSSGQKASALTRQLLLFSRRQKSEFKQLNLGNMIDSMQKILSRMLGEDISIVYNCNDKDMYFDGDESQVEQIIMNLAINARDAMPEGGLINVEVNLCEVDQATNSSFPYFKEGKYICLNFTDSGCGIPKNVLEHIFEPFFTTKEVGRGTGLGLANVYSIIKQHQGFINVESKLNKGTCFKVYFPLSENQKHYETTSSEREFQTGGKKRVLILEDDDNVRDLANQVLTQYGYLVKCVSNIKQANDAIKNETYDLFFIDIVLPDGNGVSFWESIKEEHSKSAFILSSGYTEDKPQIKNTIHKGYSFLHKPFTIVALLNACTEALSSKTSQ